MSAIRLRWLLFAIATVVGTVLFWVLSSLHARAGLSFLGGVVVAVVIFETSTFNVRYTDRFFPRLTLPVAVLTYGMTAIALAVILAAASPRVVVGSAVACGLASAVLIWIGTEIARLRVR
jgi:hypothetical protein